MKAKALLGALLLAAAGGAAWWHLQPAAAPPTYTVVRGDSLSKIARAHQTTVADLRRWNGISGDLIEVGQVLVVGEVGAPEASSAAPRAAAPRSRRRSVGGGAVQAPPEAPPGGPSWTLPPEEPCREGPSVDDLDGTGDEAAFAASVGLSHGQLQAAMGAHLPSLSACLTPGQPVTGTLDLEITVACTGRVAAVAVLDDDGLPEGLTACVTDGLRYADFPAHDMPDGFTFGYPMRFSP